MRTAFVLTDRSDQELLTGIAAAVGREREDLANVIAHLAEMDRRELALPEGCSSLSKYCVEVLHLSERQAYRRVDVAQRARRFPIILEMLAEGLIHVTAVYRLGPSLTEENHVALLKEATHKTREQIEEIVARLRPKPPVSSMIRKLPSPNLSASSNGKAVTQTEPGFFANGSGSAGAMESLEPEPVREMATVPVRSTPSRKSAVSPLAPEIYKVQFTASARMRKKLKQLQELMRHRVPSGDLATLLEMGVDRLLDEVSRERFAKVDRPRKSKAADPVQSGEENGDHESRHIPNEVKREVWSRDDGQCAFVSENGRRCSERSRIEYHHVVPFAWGGDSTVQNIQLRCRAHNAYEGEVIFGKVVRKGKENGRATPTDPERSSVNGCSLSTAPGSSARTRLSPKLRPEGASTAPGRSSVIGSGESTAPGTVR